MIKELQELLAIHGDIKVCVREWDGCHGEDCPCYAYPADPVAVDELSVETRRNSAEKIVKVDGY
jgi:hypothetical protein